VPSDLDKPSEQAKHKKVMTIADKPGLDKTIILNHQSKRNIKTPSQLVGEN
jgi:hypothetical protein